MSCDTLSHPAVELRGRIPPQKVQPVLVVAAETGYLINLCVSLRNIQFTDFSPIFLRRHMPRIFFNLATFALLGLISFQTTIHAQNNRTDLHENNACGPYSLYSISKYLGGHATLEEVFEVLPPSGQPRSLNDILRACHAIKLYTRPIRWNQGGIPNLVSPAIIRMSPDSDGLVGHFILLLSYNEGYFLVLDPASTSSWIPKESIWDKWDGVALHVARNESQLPEIPRKSFSSSLITYAIVLCVLTLLLHGFCAEKKLSQTTLSHKKSLIIKTAIVVIFFSSILIAALKVVPSELAIDDPVIGILPRRRIIPMSETRSGQSSDYPVVTFQVYNRSNDLVTIDHAVSSCGCAAPNIKAHVIQPHGFVNITVKILRSSITSPRQFDVSVYLSKPAHHPPLIFEGVLTP